MKKILYNIAVLLALACAVVSCGDDDDTNNKGSNPAEAAAGTYTGEWTVYDRKQDKSMVFEGTVELTVEEGKPYVTNISTSTSSTDDLAKIVKDKTSVSNITYANDSFIFGNGRVSTQESPVMDGRIDGEVMRLKYFTTFKPTGQRSTYVYDVSFVGSKTGSDNTDEQ